MKEKFWRGVGGDSQSREAQEREKFWPRTDKVGLCFPTISGDEMVEWFFY